MNRGNRRFAVQEITADSAGKGAGNEKTRVGGRVFSRIQRNFGYKGADIVTPPLKNYKPT